ncbi:MAG: Mpv17/PMP22 family protein [Puniceicoccales bacterium]|jgi:hypothetical protein|nr:Mpv17/PMP22 family protein [Puniceicoccales bacterium]
MAAPDLPDSPPQPMSPWRMGWVAARINFVPGLILQAAAAALLVAYFQSETVHGWLSAVAELKQRAGYCYTMLSGAVFCGLIPWLFRMATPVLRPRNAGSDLLFSVLYWGGIFIVTDSFYQAQAWFWGDTSDPRIVAVKTACDMLLFTPVIAAPCNSISHLWKEKRFSFVETRKALRGNWYRNIVMPNLVPNWMLWTPGIAITYSLPVLLQLPMANLIGCFWALLCVTIAAGGKKQQNGKRDGAC